MLGILKRASVSSDIDLGKKLYTSMIRHFLEYAVQIWNPILIGDVERIEMIQRRATKIPTKLSKLSYDQRLTVLGLTSLKDKSWNILLSNVINSSSLNSFKAALDKYT